MTGDELKQRMQAMKAEADKRLEKRMSATAEKSRYMRMRLEGAKTVAAVDHTLRTLETGEKPLRQVNNRPAEKIVRGKTKGMKRKYTGITP